MFPKIHTVEKSMLFFMSAKIFMKYIESMLNDASSFLSLLTEWSAL